MPVNVTFAPLDWTLRSYKSDWNPFPWLTYLNGENPQEIFYIMSSSNITYVNCYKIATFVASSM